MPVAVFILRIVALFNSKLKLGFAGRFKTFTILEKEIKTNDKVFWFHCASLGEYEQGLPVFEALREEHPNHKIVLSFFSPSGYEVQKNSPIANCAVYLPWDSKSKVKKFLDITHPELVIFVKYEIWPNYLYALQKRQVKALLICALFSPNQVYFKWYGNFMKKALHGFEHIFTQDVDSKMLLQSNGINQVSISGDTRFDRVSNQLQQDNTLDIIEDFKSDNLCIVAGSTWPEDEQILVDFINSHQHDNLKFIIAPHNIKPNQISKLQASVKQTSVLYSEHLDKNLREFKVFILDTVGLLKKVYSYADIAYVGGAMGSTGLHNTLEPAAFGIPIVIGKHYDKFPEAKAMIENKGMTSVSNFSELRNILESLVTSSQIRLEFGLRNSDYISKNKGAVIQILDYLRK